MKCRIRQRSRGGRGSIGGGRLAVGSIMWAPTFLNAGCFLDFCDERASAQHAQGAGGASPRPRVGAGCLPRLFGRGRGGEASFKGAPKEK